MTKEITLKLNGKEHSVEVEPRLLLVHLIREDLAQTGTHIGCDTTSCGACTVLIDGKSAKSCTILAIQADGKEITTIEGLAQDGRLHPIQQAFIDYGGFQCGICTPGQIMAAKALLDVNANPTEEEIREWMMGNLCRCTGYYKILESIVQAIGPTAEAGR